jgi:kynurenine formamidase
MSVLNTLLTGLSNSDIEVIDLTAPLSSSTPILRLPAPFANTVPLSMSRVSDFDDDGPLWAWNDLHLGEHSGTHLDAPSHWISGREGASVDEIPAARLIGPIVVIDKTAETEHDSDFLLEPEHFEEWERDHGPIPDNAWVLLKTGWSSRVHDAELFANADENGPHTPGVSVEGAKWMAANPSISGFGVETVGIDAGAAGGFDPIFPGHYYLLGADKFGLTTLQNLDKLPTTGAVLIVAPLPIVGGTGSPTRVFALVHKQAQAGQGHAEQGYTA